ncbi:MAG: hypothetical protein IJF45_06735 [Clostridia bacterium]|nr:hypothetical protein [Clostridia bacterium]
MGKRDEGACRYRYEGNFNYEASGFIKNVPQELRPDGLAFMARVGHYLVSRFEYYKKNR